MASLARRFPDNVHALGPLSQGAARCGELPHLRVVSEHDTFSAGTWFLIGSEAPKGCSNVIALTSGHERREPDTVWLRNWSSLQHLGSLRHNGGVAQLLRAEGPQSIRLGILEHFQPAISALRERRSAYVFGTRRLGTMVGQGIQGFGYRIAGFFENQKSAWGGTHLGAKVHAMDDKSDRSIPVVIGTTKYPFTLGKQARDAGFQFVMPYPVMTLIDAALFPPEIPYIGIHEDLIENRARYLTEYFNYSDDRSRQVLDRLLHYRMTFQPEHVQDVFDPEIDQYFDTDIVRLAPDEVFVDAGGFDGQTTLEFIKRCGGQYRHIYYFEPDSNLMQRSRNQALAGREAIDFCNAGAFSFDGKASFCSTGTVNGSVSLDEAGDVEIDVRKIDSIASEAPTFIKMDIEGAEYEALKGASHHIAEHQPRLAVAAYHEGPDVWRLGALIRDLNPDYRLYLRHYTEGGLETVIYAINDRARQLDLEGANRA
jgi:FkbM family methyltransferase